MSRAKVHDTMNIMGVEENKVTVELHLNDGTGVDQKRP